MTRDRRTSGPDRLRQDGAAQPSRRSLRPAYPYQGLSGVAGLSEVLARRLGLTVFPAAVLVPHLIDRNAKVRDGNAGALSM